MNKKVFEILAQNFSTTPLAVMADGRICDIADVTEDEEIVGGISPVRYHEAQVFNEPVTKRMLNLVPKKIGYRLSVCTNGIFEGYCRVAAGELWGSIENFLNHEHSVVRDEVGNLFSRVDGIIKQVTEEEAFDIVCGDADMSGAKFPW